MPCSFCHNRVRIWGSFLLLKIIDKWMGLRVPDQDEVTGLDLSQHDEMAYNL